MTGRRKSGTRWQARCRGAEGRLLGWARAARELADRRRQLAMLEAVYPAARRMLDLDPDWVVHRVVSTVGDVGVAVVGGDEPSAVLKCAHTARGTAALVRSGAAAGALASDPGLGGWAKLLPRRLATARSPAGHLVVLEELLPGEDSRAAVTPATAETVTAAVNRCVATLHERTGARTAVDDALLERWVDDPVDVLRAHVPTDDGTRRPELDLLQRGLRQSLLGRPVTVGWVHGDLAPGNVLLDPTTHQVSGLLDWERASPAGMPQLDTIHWRLTAQMHVQHRELGAIVCDLLDRGAATAADGTTDPALLVLAWLHHVSGNLAKSERFLARSFWATRNVQPVLRRVGAGAEWLVR